MLVKFTRYGSENPVWINADATSWVIGHAEGGALIYFNSDSFVHVDENVEDVAETLRDAIL